jgi:hypothetical protein
MISPPVIIQEAQTFFRCSYLLFMSAKTLALSPTAPESFHNTAYSDGLQKETDGVFAAILSGVPLIIALPNSLPRITRPSRIG